MDAKAQVKPATCGSLAAPVAGVVRIRGASTTKRRRRGGHRGGVGAGRDREGVHADRGGALMTDPVVEPMPGTVRYRGSVRIHAATPCGREGKGNDGRGKRRLGSGQLRNQLSGPHDPHAIADCLQLLKVRQDISCVEGDEHIAIVLNCVHQMRGVIFVRDDRHQF